MKNDAFWAALDALIGGSKVVIDRPKGSKHPHYDFIYEVDYGYLEGTSSMDGGGIDVWRGSRGGKHCDAIICIVDLIKKDSEIKLLIGCDEDETQRILRFHNEKPMMKGILVNRNERKEGSAVIRPAVDQDAAALGAVYCFSWQKAYKNIVPDAFLEALTVESCTAGSISPKHNLVLEDHGAVVGTVSFGAARDEDAKNAGEVRAIYVLPDCWKKGYGRLLLCAAAAQLQESGYASYHLWTLKQNQRARGFYEKMGMQNTGRERTLTIGGKDLEEVKYEFVFDHNPTK